MRVLRASGICCRNDFTGSDVGFEDNAGESPRVTCRGRSNGGRSHDYCTIQPGTCQ